jgi:tripartite-type tricarboxylate transporter receptor subunit TctC
LPYDPFADVSPVSNGVTFDYGFAVGTGVPEAVRTVPEFMAWCKANPGKASIGSPATGSTLHFTGIVLGRAAGVEITHVGYRGSQAAVQDLIGGQLPALIGPLGEFIRHTPGGRVRLLASSGAQRSRFTPDVPTLAEQGYKDMVFSEWFGFFLPGKVAPEGLVRLNEALRSALSAPDVAAGLAAFALEPSPSSPTALAQLLRSDFERWKSIVRSIGFTAEN